MKKPETERPIKWAIEDSFPIVEINRLAVPERNAFKPIYKMHKWFARRASCVFRAILLGCLKPLPVDKDGHPTKSGAQTIMEEFYKDHAKDADTNGKTILDPFMGGGTTVVEALRLGCKVIGIDLNPVAWFIVKAETTPVDIDGLKGAFDRLANRIVPWSGKPLKQTLLELYKTTCPCCGNPDADIIYAFWVKSAVCTDPNCRKLVPLFGDYIIASKQPSIRYYQDVSCSKCHKTFDWEIEPASLIAEQSLIVVNNADGAGVGRGNKRWAFATEEPVGCPWCGESIKPRLAAGKTRTVRKKVPLTVLLCPDCQGVWQYRGSVPDKVACPACKHEYEPRQGNIPKSGKFVCPHCGKRDDILASIRSLPEDQLLPTSKYALQGHCPSCKRGGDDDTEGEDAFEANLGASTVGSHAASASHTSSANEHRCLLAKSGGKFYKRIAPVDIDLYARASNTWHHEQTILPFPQSAVPLGDKTKSGLIAHHYRHWHQLFNPRQLLAASTILAGIQQEPVQAARDLLLCAFSNMLEANNVFTRNRPTRNSPGGTAAAGIFSRHDYQPKATFSEQNVWGGVSGSNTIVNRVNVLYEGLRYAKHPWDTKLVGGDQRRQRVGRNESVGQGDRPVLVAGDSCEILSADVLPCDAVITDPPYSDNVNYAELSDFFYVWLRLVLARELPVFVPEYTPKAQEIITNRSRGLSDDDFRQGLQAVFELSGRGLSTNGLLIFTFHHAAGATWEVLLQALCDGGWEIEAVYPVHAESEVSLHLMDKQGISYDLIHVCRKRGDGAVEARSWAGMRQEIRRRARQEIETIERGRYGNEPLSPADVNIVLIGKCLELYSRHYGHVVDHEGQPVPLHEALEAIRMEVDQLVTKEQPLPGELADIDPVSYMYLMCLADKVFEVKVDDLYKFTRGVIEPDELLKAGLIIKGRTGRGRFFKIKSPAERFAGLQARFTGRAVDGQSALPGLEEAAGPRAGDRTPFIDYVHFLIGLAEGGENLRPWMERFRGLTPQIRAACEFLKVRQSRFASACDKILKFIEVTPLLG